jgi:subtilisin family serine protease
MKRLLINALVILSFALSLSLSALAQESEPQRPLPETLAEFKLDSPVRAAGVMPASKLEKGLMSATGAQRVIVRLAGEPVAEAAAQGESLLAQKAQFASVSSQQDQLIARAMELDQGARVLGSVQKTLNAVMLEIDADSLPALAAGPEVISVHAIIDYQMDLSETVPYIGGSAVQALGFDGTGVRVAVLDSGIDYTHANLGGSGNPGDYTANDPTLIEPGTFPTAKVVGGFDFVGATWPDTDETPDPDPLDDGPGAGHGTHVADIIAGTNGVAPSASLYAVKVCSSISTACSGVALIQAMEFAVDPNGDGDLSDHVDIINMSLGSLYGQAFDDDLSFAVQGATKIGVLTVAAAGNAADKPYVVDTPSAEPSAFSVAQTSVPSAIQIVMEVVSPPEIAGSYAAVFQPWSLPLTGLIEAPVQYADGAGGNLLGCEPFAAGSLAGKIVLVDRGGCNFTLKIKNIGDAGGLVGIIGMVAPGDPFEGGDGGEGPITIPGFMISLADAGTLKSQLGAGVVARFDPAAGLPLVKHMVGSSSRGPTMLTNLIKPEIGAPGASVSAKVGTGTEVGPFGGTSGATPMISGSAALLMQAFPARSPLEIKAVLMNTAETDIMNKPELFGGYLAAISRIGGGEVRVDRAVASPVAAWDEKLSTGALSFGFHDVTGKTLKLQRTVTVRNYTNQRIVYAVRPTFRFLDDAETKAVSIKAPDRITVPARGVVKFDVTLTINGIKLREWGLDSGGNGANPDALTHFEYDGYILLDNTKTADDDMHPLHLAWHVLPRLSGDVKPGSTRVKINGEAFGLPAGFTSLRNNGIGTARIDTYSLIGKSPNLPESGQGENAPIIDLRYVGVATFPVPAGFCSDVDSFIMAFAVNTWERQTHANAPASFEFDLDVNRDGVFDFAVFNFDLSLSTSLSDGRNVTWVADLATGDASAFFTTEHGTNSGNTVLYFCGDQIGMNASNFFQPIDLQAVAFDAYFTGNPTDSLAGLTVSPLGERYLGHIDDFGLGDILYNATKTLTVIDFGPEGTNPTETGLLLLLDGARAGGIRGGAPSKNEAIAITAVP